MTRWLPSAEFQRENTYQNFSLPWSRDSDWWRPRGYYQRGIFAESAADVLGIDSFKEAYRFGKGLFSSEDRLQNFLRDEEIAWRGAGRPRANQATRRAMDPLMDALNVRRGIREISTETKSLIAASTAAAKAGKPFAGVGAMSRLSTKIAAPLSTTLFKVAGPAFAVFALGDVAGDINEGYRSGGVSGGAKAGVASLGSWVLQQVAWNAITRNPYVMAAAGVGLATVGSAYMTYKAADAISQYGGEIRKYSPWKGNMEPFMSRSALTMRQQSAMIMGETGLAPRGYLGNEAMRLHL